MCSNEKRDEKACLQVAPELRCQTVKGHKKGVVEALNVSADTREQYEIECDRSQNGQYIVDALLRVQMRKYH